MKIVIVLLLPFLSIAYGLECMTGQLIQGQPIGLPIKQETCVSDLCMTLEYGVSQEITPGMTINVTAVQGVCGSSVMGCGAFCPYLKTMQPTMKDCKCCDTAECNKKLGNISSASSLGSFTASVTVMFALAAYMSVQ